VNKVIKVSKGHCDDVNGSVSQNNGGSETSTEDHHHDTNEVSIILKNLTFPKLYFKKIKHD
jgi:hypothetical protein